MRKLNGLIPQLLRHDNLVSPHDQLSQYPEFISHGFVRCSLEFRPITRGDGMANTRCRVGSRSDSLSTWRGANAAGLGMASATMVHSYSSVRLIATSGELSTGNLLKASAAFSLSLRGRICSSAPCSWHGKSQYLSPGYLPLRHSHSVPSNVSSA